MKVQNSLLKDEIDDHRYAFQLLPSYQALLEEADPEGHFHLELAADGTNFSRFFVAPAASVSAWNYCHHIFGVDGTFLTGKFRLTLLLAVTIDANNLVLILAWAIVEGENLSSWNHFLYHLRKAILGVNHGDTIKISDREKGLKKGAAALNVNEDVLHVYCCRHLKENMIKGRGGNALNAAFWKIARAKTPAKYGYYMDKLREVSASAALYPEKIDPTRYCHAYVPQSCRGIDTNNMTEVVNNMLKLERGQNVIKLLDSIWHKVMTMRFTRMCKAIREQNNDRRYTLYCA